jgi:hypothetical protein
MVDMFHCSRELNGSDRPLGLSPPLVSALPSELDSAGSGYCPMFTVTLKYPWKSLWPTRETRPLQIRSMETSSGSGVPSWVITFPESMTN